MQRFIAADEFAQSITFDVPVERITITSHALRTTFVPTGDKLIHAILDKDQTTILITDQFDPDDYETSSMGNHDIRFLDLTEIRIMAPRAFFNYQTDGTTWALHLAGPCLELVGQN